MINLCYRFYLIRKGEKEKSVKNTGKKIESIFFLPVSSIKGTSFFPFMHSVVIQKIFKIHSVIIHCKLIIIPILKDF